MSPQQPCPFIGYSNKGGTRVAKDVQCDASRFAGLTPSPSRGSSPDPVDVRGADRALRRLEYLDVATRWEDLKVPPSNRLHKRGQTEKDSLPSL